MITFTAISCSEDSMEIKPQNLKLEINSTSRYYNQKLIEYKISDDYNSAFTFDRFQKQDNGIVNWIIFKDADGNDYYLTVYKSDIQTGFQVPGGSVMVYLYKSDLNEVYSVTMSVQRGNNGNKIYSNKINY